MKVKTLLIVGLVLLIFSIGAVSAQDNSTLEEVSIEEVPESDNQNLQLDDSNEILEADDSSSTLASGDDEFDPNDPHVSMVDRIVVGNTVKIHFGAVVKNKTKVSVFIDNKAAKITKWSNNAGSQIIVDSKSLKVGLHDVVVKYDNKAVFTDKLNVDKMVVYNTVPDECMDPEGQHTEFIQLYKGAQGKLYLYLDGVLIDKCTVTKDKQYYYFEIFAQKQTAEIHDVRVIFKSGSLKIVKDDKLKNNYSETNYYLYEHVSGHDYIIEWDSHDNSTGTLEVTIKGKTYKEPIVDGKAYFKLSNLPGGYYSSHFVFKIDGEQYHQQKSTDFIVKPAYKVTLKKIKVKKSAKKVTLKAKLIINNKLVKGKKITFKFHKKTIKAKTNSKGIAKVKISKSYLKKLKVGKKVKYSATFKNVSVKKTAKVKR